jgi:phage anti-repressor protein
MKHIAITKQVLDGTEVNAVSSRDLHKHLEVKTEYKKWADRLIEKYQFVENEDFITIVKNVGRNALTDYVFTLDTAKEVCMVSNTDKGRETRKFFIDVEKQHSKNSLVSLSDHIEKTKALFYTQEVMGEVITDISKRVENIEKNSRLEAWQEKTLQDAKNKKVYELANGNDKLASKLHRNVWREFKKRFHIPRYNELTTGRYEDGLMWLNNVQLHEVV